MKMLKRNEVGQFTDERVNDITNDITESLKQIFNKYNDICAYDIEILMHTTVAYLSATKTMKDKNRIKV